MTSTEADPATGVLNVVRGILSRGSYGLDEVEALRSMVDAEVDVGDSQLAQGVIQWIGKQLAAKGDVISRRNGDDLH